MPFAFLATSLAAAAPKTDNDKSTPSAAQYALESADTRRIEAKYTYAVHCPDMVAKRWFIFMAQAPEFPGQRDVKTTATPAGRVTPDGRLSKRDLLVVEIPADKPQLAQDARVEVTYTATLRSRKLRTIEAAQSATAESDAAPSATAKPKRLAEKPAAAKSIDLSNNERKTYLAATYSADHSDPEFAEFLDKENLKRAADEDEVTFARRVYQLAKQRGKYEYRQDLDRRASSLAKTWRSDCGGWSNWFVGVMRAGGVPARILVGRLTESAKPGGTPGNALDYQGHIRAEFFATGVGWVPVDLSQAIQYDRRASSMRYFGHDEGDLLVLHIDGDFEVYTKPSGKRQYRALQTPAYWVVGEGKTNTAQFVEDWRVRNIEAAENRPTKPAGSP